jgi:haloacid dehalogenase-like hydrolase
MALVDVVAAAGEDPDELLRLVGAVESASEHPIGRAIAAAAADRAGTLPAVTEFRNAAGLGVTGLVEGQAVVAGRPGLLADWALTVPSELDAARRAAEAAGRTPIFGGWDGRVRGLLVVADQPKPASVEAIAALRELGLTPVLLTGDNRPARRRRRHPAVPPDPGHHQGQPVLGVRRQRRRAAAGRRRPAQPADRRRRDGVQLGVRRDQQPAAAPVPPPARPPDELDERVEPAAARAGRRLGGGSVREAIVTAVGSSMLGLYLFGSLASRESRRCRPVPFRSRVRTRYPSRAPSRAHAQLAGGHRASLGRALSWAG